MRIAMVIPKYGLVGGAEGFAYELTERLVARQGFEVHVFANQWRQGGPAITFHKIPTISFPRFIRPISFAYFVHRKIHPQDFDLIHSHDRIFHMDLLTMHGIPHKTWIRETRRKSLSLFDRSTAWVEEKGINDFQVKMVLPVSTLVKEELLRRYDIPESRVRIVHPGVSTERFSALDKEDCRYEIRQRHGLSSKDVVVLFVGMNFEIKRLSLLIRAIARCCETGNENAHLKLLVLGKGKQDKYLTLAHELRIADRIIFAGVTQEVEKYYLACDIFAMPSRFDTFGLAVLEAMAAGLPVIITRTVGARDLIDSGTQGFVLPADPSPLDITEKLLLLMSENLRMRMGETARDIAQHHTWDRVVDQMVDLYHHLSASDGRR